MTSVEELERHVRDYLEGRLPLDGLEDLLTRAADDVAATDDPQLRRLHNSAWLKIGEFDEQLLTEEELVSGLWASLLSAQTRTWDGLAVGTMPSPGRRIEREAVAWRPFVLTSQPGHLAATGI